MRTGIHHPTEFVELFEEFSRCRTGRSIRFELSQQPLNLKAVENGVPIRIDPAQIWVTHGVNTEKDRIEIRVRHDPTENFTPSFPHLD